MATMDPGFNPQEGARKPEGLRHKRRHRQGGARQEREGRIGGPAYFCGRYCSKEVPLTRATGLEAVV